uniref:Cyclic nucleotide-binding domain-containing protein n=1 Tax=Globisporangium ultimum (strain ATCC 200006 / CBS 805.95 / DAOM BR144) TaxID=431595 RepID=K3WCY5_GLOUD
MPKLSATTTTTTTSRPISATGSVSAASAAGSARPFSSSNLSASIANARFKTFQMQYEILCKNPILYAIAKEIAWKNLLDLFLLKFYAVGDVLWRQGDQPHEMAFILCGGFLARHMEQHSVESVESHYSNQHHHAAPNGGPVKVMSTILAEKMVKPGGSIAALAVHTNSHLPYSTVTAKFKSIALSLPSGKYKSILRQLSPHAHTLLQNLLYETENKLLIALKMQPITPPKEKHHHNNMSRTKSSPRKSGLSRSASTPSMARTTSSAVVPTLDATGSWASLQVAKPVEYEVNSSLLVLHQSSSVGNLHGAAGSRVAQKKSTTPKCAMLSSVARLTAKKHTQRRLQSIKLPNPMEAFPPPPKFSPMDSENSDADPAILAAFGGRRAVHVDVVPKVHVGRLLKPLKKPAMFDDLDPDLVCDERGRKTTSSSQRPNSVAPGHSETHGRRVLAADRAESFRDMW